MRYFPLFIFLETLEFHSICYKIKENCVYPLLHFIYVFFCNFECGTSRCLNILYFIFFFLASPFGVPSPYDPPHTLCSGLALAAFSTISPTFIYIIWLLFWNGIWYVQCADVISSAWRSKMKWQVYVEAKSPCYVLVEMCLKQRQRKF